MKTPPPSPRLHFFPALATAFLFAFLPLAADAQEQLLQGRKSLLLDAGETTAKSYMGFLFKIPPDFMGVASIQIKEGRLLLRERRDPNPRELSLNLAGLPPL